MITISNTYDLNWMLYDTNEYQFTQCGKCFNIKRGKEVKRTLVGYSIGFCIKGKFRTLKSIRKDLVKIEKSYCPF